jgi:hypothetical protein
VGIGTIALSPRGENRLATESRTRRCNRASWGTRTKGDRRPTAKFPVEMRPKRCVPREAIVKIADWVLWERAGDTSKLVKIPFAFPLFPDSVFLQQPCCLSGPRGSGRGSPQCAVFRRPCSTSVIAWYMFKSMGQWRNVFRARRWDVRRRQALCNRDGLIVFVTK